MRASQADVTLTCTRRSSARRALLTLSLPPSVRVPPDRDGVNTRSRDQAERDQTSQDPRSQWNAERGRVFFKPRPAAHAGRAVRPVSMHGPVRLRQVLSVGLTCRRLSVRVVG